MPQRNGDLLSGQPLSALDPIVIEVHAAGSASRRCKATAVSVRRRKAGSSAKVRANDFDFLAKPAAVRER